MSLENTTAKYTIQLVREGTAAPVTQELQQLNQTFQQTALHSGRANSQFHELHLASRALKSSFHEVHEVGILMSAHMAPELTAGLMSVSTGMHALRAIGIATGASLGVVGAALGGLIAILFSVTEGWHALHAAEQQRTSQEGLLNQQFDLRKRLLLQIRELDRGGQLSHEEALRMGTKLLQSPEEDMGLHIASVQKRLREVVGTTEQEEAINKLRDLRDKMATETLDDYAKERAQAFQLFNERMEQILALKAAAGNKLTDDQLKLERSVAAQALNAQLERVNARETEGERQKLIQQTAEVDKFATDQMAEFERKLTIESLTSGQKREAQANHEFAARMGLYDDLYLAGFITEQKLVALQEEASIKRLQLIQKEHKAVELHVKTVQEMEVDAAQGFAQGFSHAFVDFASGSKSAGDAFKEFAVTFLKSVAEMILETEILAVIKSIAGLAAGGVRFAAMGGAFAPIMAASGVPGVSSISSPTYFPKFNVVGGEAGREMLTVLAQPRFMEVGGIQAVVGNAAGHRLAITQADDLAGGGAGRGAIEIRVSMDPGLRAEIVSDSVQGATVRVTQEMGRNSRLRETTKQAVRS